MNRHVHDFSSFGLNEAEEATSIQPEGIKLTGNEIGIIAGFASTKMGSDHRVFSTMEGDVAKKWLLTMMENIDETLTRYGHSPNSFFISAILKPDVPMLKEPGQGGNQWLIDGYTEKGSVWQAQLKQSDPNSTLDALSKRLNSLKITDVSPSTFFRF